MQLTLEPHPDTPSEIIEDVLVDLEWVAPSTLRISYDAEGDADRIAHPDEAGPGRADGLWRTTCFEFFVMSGPGESYLEFNFSSSGQWAAYRFDRYREGMMNLIGVDIRLVDHQFAGHAYTMKIELDLGGLVRGATAPPWRIGVSAVIEAEGGSKSYWALRHPSGQPDFHHPEAFAASLAPPESP